MRMSCHLTALVSLALIVGCGRTPDKPTTRTYPVRGKVLLANGQPLPSGTVVFHAKLPPGNDAMSLIHRDGSFALGTFGKDDGAVPGEYVVTVSAQPAKRLPGAIPKRFLKEEESPLKVTVNEGANELAPFTLR